MTRIPQKINFPLFYRLNKPIQSNGNLRLGKFPTEAAAPCQIGLISWPYAFCLASRDARQASNSIFAEKTIAGRWGKRPSFPRTLNSPRETRVAKTPQYNGGVNECPSFSMPSQSISDLFLAPQVPHCACPRDTRPAPGTTKTRYLLSSMIGMSYPSSSDPRYGKFLTRGKREGRTRL